MVDQIRSFLLFYRIEKKYVHQFIAIGVRSREATETYQMSEVPLGENTDENGKGTEGDKDLVSAVVVGRICYMTSFSASKTGKQQNRLRLTVFAVNLRRDDRSNLDNNVVSGDLHRSTFDRETVLRDGTSQDLEIKIHLVRSSVIHCRDKDQLTGWK